LVFAGVTPPDGTSVALLKEITRRAPPTSGYFFISAAFIFHQKFWVSAIEHGVRKFLEVRIFQELIWGFCEKLHPPLPSSNIL
jgi:hypothetical protein